MKAALAWVAAASMALGCSQSPAMRGKIAGLSDIVEQAERNGAIRCAPRELAVAKSQLEFAALELDQGFISKARKHLWEAAQRSRRLLPVAPAVLRRARLRGSSASGAG
jgi:OOP family OmpA-OmpF porin